MPWRACSRPNAGLFVAAKRQCGIDDGVAIAPDRAGFDFGCEPVHGRDVLGPDAGAEAITGVVGCLRDFVKIVEALRYHHRSEDLFAHDAHVGVHVDENCRVDVVAVRGWSIAADRTDAPSRLPASM